MRNFDSGITEVLITEDQIKQRITELAATINNDYANSAEPLILVVLMKGAFIFAADLVRAIQLPVDLEFMIVSSYGDKVESSREVHIIQDIEEAIAGRNVIVIDDIIDTGLTLQKIMQLLESRQPLSLKSCTLLDKAARRETGLEANYVGFTISNKFVVGYGLDYAQNYRNIPYIGILNPELIS